MTIKEIVNKIKDHIATGDDNDVFAAIDLLKEHGKGFENELVIHSSNFADAQKSRRIGILPYREFVQDKTKICSALLKLTDTLEQQIVQQFHFNLAPTLKEVLALAEFQSRRDGKPETSTKYFFAALRKLKPDSIKEFLIEIEIQNALPKPISDEVLAAPRTFSSSRALSHCLIDSITQLSEIATESNPIQVEDMFVDVAKFGTGQSVKKLRKHKIDKKAIERLVDKYQIKIKRRK